MISFDFRGAGGWTSDYVIKNNRILGKLEIEHKSVICIAIAYQTKFFLLTLPR